MNAIDLIVLIILGAYFIKGLLKGFLQTFINPLALIAGAIIAVVYHQQSGDFLKALLICILSPFIIKLAFLLILKIWHKTIKERETLTFGSRLSGGALAVLWSGIWLIVTLIFLAVVPSKWNWVSRLQHHILKSNTYTAIHKVVGEKLPIKSLNAYQLSGIFQDPDKFEALKDTQEYRDLINDKTIRELLSDKETMEQLNNQDIPKLLANPNFNSLLNDKELLKKIFALHKKLVEMEASGEI